MMLPDRLENRMNSPYEYVHQVYPAIPARSPVENNENKPLSDNPALKTNKKESHSRI